MLTNNSNPHARTETKKLLISRDVLFDDNLFTMMSNYHNQKSIIFPNFNYKSGINNLKIDVCMFSLTQGLSPSSRQLFAASSSNPRSLISLQ